eukprot:scaffold3296_cov159-Ochromonas_danica.AAC.5
MQRWEIVATSRPQWQEGGEAEGSSCDKTAHLHFLLAGPLPPAALHSDALPALTVTQRGNRDGRMKKGGRGSAKGNE